MRPLSAQATNNFAYDVVSIKEHPPNGIVSMVGIENSPNGMHGAAMTIPMLVAQAYGAIGDEEVLDSPQWGRRERFDIEAKMSEADVAAMKGLNREDSQERRGRMLQALLVERFHLKVHRQMKPMPIYELTVMKRGAKLKETAMDDSPNVVKGPDGQPYIGLMQFMKDHTVAQGCSMARLASALTNPMYGLGRPVFDKTGMIGVYDFTLNWSPQMGKILPGAVGDMGTPEGEVSIFTALAELGLKLQPTTAAVETIVIDHVERPTEN